jgi:POT family proton-dependent oligopeptide transporter
MNQVQQRPPAGLWLICLTEIFERFSYYGMRGLLIFYLVYALKMDSSAAANIYGSFTSLVYLSGLLGGYVADRYLGQKQSIIWGAAMIAIGQFLLGVESMGFMYVAMGFLIMGNGFFKISISTMVGSLYEKGDPRRDSGFTYFYMAVNVGAFFGGIIAGGIGEKLGWKYGFWTAGAFMVAGLIIFLVAQKKYFAGKGERPSNFVLKDAVRDALIFAACIVLAVLLGFWTALAVVAAVAAGFYIKNRTSAKTVRQSDGPRLTIEEKKKIAVIFIMAFFVIFFWAAFEQSGAALNLFAKEHTNRILNFFGLFTWEIPATWFQSLNPVFVVLFAPLFSKLWVDLAEKSKEPSTPGKFVWALWLLAAGYVVLLIAAMQMGPGVKVGMLYLVFANAAFTMGELCLSPVGLSLVTKLAPVQYVGMLMGVWKVANAVANKLAGTYSSYFGKISNESFFSGLVIAPIIASVILMILMKPIKKWMGDVR